MSRIESVEFKFKKDSKLELITKSQSELLKVNHRQHAIKVKSLPKEEIFSVFPRT